MLEILHNHSWLETTLPSVVRFGLEQRDGCEQFFPNGISELIHSYENVITGQQAGFFGGPLYTTYKRWTAEFLSSNDYHNFWIESGDSDWNEIATVYWGSQIRKWEDSLPNVPIVHRQLPSSCYADISQMIHSPLHHERLEKIKDAFYGNVVDSFISFHKLIGFANATRWCVSPPALEPTTNKHYQNVLVQWFRELRKGITSIKQGIARVQSKFGIVQAELSENRSGWYYQKERGTPRIPLFIENDQFILHDKRYSEIELSEIVQCEKGSFIPGVLWRPLVQQVLFSPDAVVLGPSEAAYWSELVDLFQWAGVYFPKVVIRIGATILSSKYQSLTTEEILSNNPPQIQKLKTLQDFEDQIHQFNQQLELLKTEVPIHLKDAISKGQQKINHQVHKISELLSRYLDEISGSKLKLWQLSQKERGFGGIPQERKMTLLEAYLLWGEEGIQTLYELFKSSHLGGIFLLRFRG